MRNLLREGFRRLVTTPQRHPIGDRRGFVLAIATRKGGVGKTTTSVSLAAGLARYHGKRVLLIDLDPQGHVHTAMKAQIRAGGGALSSVLTSEGGGLEVLDIVARTDIPNLDITPFDPKLGEAEDLIGTRIGKEYLLKEALRLTRTHYDVVVIDCPPNLGNLTLNGLVAADQVLIPTDASPLALNGVEALIQALGTIAVRLNPEIDVMGVLLTRFDSRNQTVNREIVGRIEESYGSALLPVRIGINTSLAKAQLEGEDIFAFDGDCRGAQQYRDLATHVAEAISVA